MAEKKLKLPNVNEGGGTLMHCPCCENITECKAIPPGSIGEKTGQRWHRTDHTDINWFRRARQCLTCEECFITAEIDEKFLAELVELRNALGNIKLHAEQYAKESNAAAKSLNKLSNSLKVLKALNLYQSEKA